MGCLLGLFRAGSKSVGKLDQNDRTVGGTLGKRSDSSSKWSSKSSTSELEMELQLEFL